MRIVASTSVPFRPATVQMPNFALIKTKWITVMHGWDTLYAELFLDMGATGLVSYSSWPTLLLEFRNQNDQSDICEGQR